MMSIDAPIEKPVRSPCVSICALDEQDICTGCQRTVSEITQWSRMSNDERRVVLGLCDERARASGLMWTVGEAR
ncbi:Fe-S protein [Pseudomonas syringae pv. tagetis]|nr:Fe-S protein [Pseudomonas syringae pv. tagetis]